MAGAGDAIGQARTRFADRPSPGSISKSSRSRPTLAHNTPRVHSTRARIAGLLADMYRLVRLHVWERDASTATDMTIVTLQHLPSTCASRRAKAFGSCVMPRHSPCRKCLILRAWTLPQVLHAVQQVAQCFVTLLASIAAAAGHGPAEPLEPLCHRLVLSPVSRLLA